MGFLVADLATGETLEALNPEEGFAPASVAKAPTALYALEALGPGFRFRTEARAAGAVADGALAGDFVLAGGGDPELDSDGLAALAEAAAARVRRVEGRFLVDPGPWPAAAMIDGDQPVAAAYNPAVGGLNLNFNRVRFRWRRKGAAVDYAMEAHAERASPPTRAVAAALMGADCGCPLFEHDDGAGREVWRVRSDALRGEGSVWLPVRAPAAYAGDVFRSVAAEAGLALPAPEIGRAPGATALAAHESRPLETIIRDMLRFSTNLTAEAIGLAATEARTGRPADLSGSARAMAEWAAALAGFPPGDPGFALANHSGLSAESRASPLRMAAFLRAAAATPLPGLLDDHPIGDRADPGPEGAFVAAKTGTLDFSRGLAGYAEAASGRRLVFAYFAGDLPRRAATRGMGRRPPGAVEWRNRAVALERALLRSWLTRFG